MTRSLFISIIAAVFSVGTVIGTQPAMGQNVSVGGGLGYGSKSNNLGFYGSIYYSLPNAPVRIGTLLGYSIREKNDNRRVDRLKGNINAYLIAVDEEFFTLYGLTGLNLLQKKNQIRNGK